MRNHTHAGDRRPGRLSYLTLAGVLLFSAFPLYWTGIVTTHGDRAYTRMPPPLTPGPEFSANAAKVFELSYFGSAMANSFLVAGTITVAVVLLSTLSGFAFAKLRFRGRNALLLTVIGTMMVPTQLGIIPLYLLMVKLGWTDTLTAVVVPSLVSAFGVFFMTQYLREALPTELLEAGRVDGCTTLRLFWHVVLPAARPAAAVLGMLTFMQAWNDFFWPLVVLTPDNPTVQVAISSLAGGLIPDYTVVLTGTVLGTVPLLLVFVVLGRYIVGGIMQGAVKG
jgi:cellobiose transport system permease protein